MRIFPFIFSFSVYLLPNFNMTEFNPDSLKQVCSLATSKYPVTVVTGSHWQAKSFFKCVIIYVKFKQIKYIL